MTLPRHAALNAITAMTAILAMAAAVPVHAQDAPIDIGSRLELFVDDYLIERFDGNADLMLHHPVAREAVMEFDRPWEGSGCGYHAIFRDGDIVRMYYKSWQLTVDDGKLILPHELFTGYAESADGIAWSRPDLGLFEFDGSKANNIVWQGPGSHDFTPFRDDNPACPPAERYKAVGRGEGEELLAFVSPDGIHWTRFGEAPILTDGYFDSENLVFWDSVRREYRAYYRAFRDDATGNATSPGKGARREIRTATSPDFLHWSEGRWLEYPGAPDEQLYTNQIKAYYRAPHIFIGFPARYVERSWDPAMYQDLPNFVHRAERAKASPRYGSAVTDALFMSSRDGMTFRRWGEAFLRPGLRQRDTWAYGDIYIGWHIIETPSGIPDAPPELSLYATEAYWTGTSNRLRRYTIRIDGFVSVHTPLSGGGFTTRPVVFDGDRLVVNFSTSAAGSMRVELQDADGRPLQGYTLDESIEHFGDSLERVVAWKNGPNVGSLAGRPVRIRFELRDCDLYSMRFR